MQLATPSPFPQTHAHPTDPPAVTTVNQMLRIIAISLTHQYLTNDNKA